MAPAETNKKHVLKNTLFKGEMNMLKNWTLFEKTWLVTSTLIILSLSFIWKDTLIGTISSLTGILCVVLVAKGRISSYGFGIINAITYGYVAYSYGLYGESDLNWFIYLPLQFVGLFLWIKHSKKKEDAINGEQVIARRLNQKQWALLLISIPIVYVAYAQFLVFRDATLAGLDGIAVVLSIVAQFLMMLRFAEQWLLWIIINVITISLWVIVLTTSGGNDWTVLAMWIAFLVNSIYGYVNWLKISKDENKVIMDQ